MKEINMRVKQLREELKLSREKFADNMRVSPFVIRNIEYDVTEVKPILIRQICETYNVNENGLLNGEGDVFVKKTLEDELIDVFGKILNDDNDFRKRMITALAPLDDDGWNAIEEFCKRIVSGGEPKEQSK